MLSGLPVIDLLTGITWSDGMLTSLINPCHLLFFSFLRSLPCIRRISRVNAPVAAHSLKATRYPRRNWVGSWGLNVIFVPAPCSARPEGRSQGLMKTNPSLCCPGSRFRELRGGRGHSRALGLQRQMERWMESKRELWFCCGGIILSKAELAKDGSRLMREEGESVSCMRIPTFKNKHYWVLFFFIPPLVLHWLSIKCLNCYLKAVMSSPLVQVRRKLEGCSFVSLVHHSEQVISKA